MKLYFSITLVVLAALSFCSKSDAQYLPTETAIQKFQTRVTENPKDIISRKLLSGLYLKLVSESGDTKYLRDALTQVDEALKSDPNARGLQIQRAVVFNALHRFREAFGILTSDKSGNTPEELAPLFDARFELGEYTEAEQMLESLTRVGDDEPAVYARAAKVKEMKGDLAEALRLVQKAEKIVRIDSDYNPELCWYLVRQGELYFKQGDLKNAESRYRDALKISKSYRPAKDHLAELFASQQRFDEALALLRELIAERDTPQLQQMLGEVLLAAGKREEAEINLKNAVKRYEESVKAGEVLFQHHLASLYSDDLPNGQLAVKYALDDYQRRQSVGTIDTLAWAYFKNGEKENARMQIDVAVKLSPKNAHILQHASQIYAARGNLDRSGDFLKAAAESNPNFNTFHFHR